jgi:nucleotide-binding universal stress UspA family protein
MSTHARTGFNRTRFGSIGDAVVRHATVPVLLVRPTAENAAAEVSPVFRRIMVGLDGSMLSEQILGPVAELARLFDARVHLVHVTVPPGDQTFSRVIRTSDDRLIRVELTPDQYLAHVAKLWTGEIGSPMLEVRRAPAPLHGIVESAIENEVDLIAMATHGRAGLKRILLGSTAGDVLANAGLPVLLFRPCHRAWSSSGVQSVASSHTVV